MKFGPVSLSEALGKILAHNVSDEGGRRVLRKGRPVDEDMLETLRVMGVDEIYVAELEAGDVHEDEAAGRIACALAIPGIDPSPPHLARVNLKATALGVVQVDAERLLLLNEIDGLTVATLRSGAVVSQGDRTATVKVIPYSLPERDVERAEAVARQGTVLRLHPLPPRDVGLVLVGGAGVADARMKGLKEAVTGRVERLGSVLAQVTYVPAEVEAIGQAVARLVEAGVQLVVLAGVTAIMDRDDIIPRGIRQAGGQIEHFGIPVDPGHLLLLAYIGDVPVMGAPGCVAGRTPDGVDLVLPRLLAGERLGRSELVVLGHGGLQGRSWREPGISR